MIKQPLDYEKPRFFFNKREWMVLIACALACFIVFFMPVML